MRLGPTLRISSELHHLFKDLFPKKVMFSGTESWGFSLAFVGDADSP